MVRQCGDGERLERRLREGFATYFTLLYTEHAAGRDAFVDTLCRRRDDVVRLEKSRPNTPVVHVNLDEAATAGAIPAIHPLEVRDREATLRIPADAAPAAVVLDPGVWLLAELGTFTKIE